MGAAEKPARHIRSTFLQVSREDWPLAGLVEFSGDKFVPVPRVSAKGKTTMDLQKLISSHEQSNEPLLLTDLHCDPAWNANLFEGQDSTKDCE